MVGLGCMRVLWCCAFEGGIMWGDIHLFPYYSTTLTSYPLFSPVHMYIPQLSSPPPMLFPRVSIFHIHKSITSMSNSQWLLAPQPHVHLSHIGWALDGLGHIHTILWHPPRVTLMPIFGRLGTRRLGTGSFSITFVVWPSQGSLERSLWISLG
jgi:hypothetical protein